MSTTPTPDNDDTDETREADRQADAMKANLREDVASWSAARHEASARQVAELVPAPVKPAAVRPSRAKPKVVAPVAQATPQPKKPFGMAYDGVTTAQHIQSMIDKGRR